MTTENQDVLAHILTLAATSVGDALAAAGLDSTEFSFTLVLWPVGEPGRCSSICGCGVPAGQTESNIALAAASEKAKRAPSHTMTHVSQGPGRLN
jgi:hypothetical protein